LTSLVFAEQISSIEYRGLYHLSPDMASEISGIREGDSFDIKRIDRAIKKLYKMGYFSDIVVSINDGGKLIFNFKEKLLSLRLDIKGYSSDEGEREGSYSIWRLRALKGKGGLLLLDSREERNWRKGPHKGRNLDFTERIKEGRGRGLLIG